MKKTTIQLCIIIEVHGKFGASLGLVRGPRQVNASFETYCEYCKLL